MGRVCPTGDAVPSVEGPPRLWPEACFHAMAGLAGPCAKTFPVEPCVAAPEDRAWIRPMVGWQLAILELEHRVAPHLAHPSPLPPAGSSSTEPPPPGCPAASPAARLPLHSGKTQEWQGPWGPRAPVTDSQDLCPPCRLCGRDLGSLSPAPLGGWWTEMQEGLSMSPTPPRPCWETPGKQGTGRTHPIGQEPVFSSWEEAGWWEGRP